MASFFVFEKKNKEIKNEADKVFCALFVFLFIHFDTYFK